MGPGSHFCGMPGKSAALKIQKIKSSTDNLTNMIGESFILVLALCCYCGDEK